MKNLLKTTCFALGLTVSVASNANLIDNGSFEENQISDNSWSVFNSIDGWTTVSGAGIEIQNNLLVTAQDGEQYVELDSHNNSTMTQEISGLDVGQAYDLSFWYQARTNNGGNDNGINVYWGEALLGDLELEVSNVIANDGGWQEFTDTLVATADTMFLSFAATGLNNSLGGFIDNVSMTAEVSEPGIVSLMGLGMFGLFASRKRLKKQAA